MDDRSRPFSVTVSSIALMAWVVAAAVLTVVIGRSIPSAIGATVGAALWVGLSLALLQGRNWARLVYAGLWIPNIACGAYLAVHAMSGPTTEVAMACLGFGAMVVNFGVLAGLAKSESTVFFTGRPGPLLDYLINGLLVRTALVFGILLFGFLASQNWVARWDLTADKRYSISPASQRIAAELPDPLTIRAYFSGQVADHYAPLQKLAFDLLAEYEAAGKGKIKVDRYDPVENSAAASEAESYGVEAAQLPLIGATERSVIRVYGSIVLIYGDRAPQVINIAENYREGYEGLSSLESDITGKIWDLSHEKAKVGITGYLEHEGGGNPMTGMQPPRPEFNAFRARLGKEFEVEDVDLDREDLDPKKIQLLLLIRPKELSDVALFRLDQYLMKGGRVLCFVTEGTIEPGWDGRFAYQPFKTGLDGWLEHHGLRVPDEFVLQLVNANPIPVKRMVEVGGNRMSVDVEVPNWFWPKFGLETAFNADNPAVQKLLAVFLYWPHPVDVLENRLEGKKATVLVRSHAAESWRWKDLRRIDMRDLSERKDGPTQSDLVSSPVVVALDGTFTSYFADRPVPPSLAAKKAEEAGEKEGTAGEKPEEKPADKPAEEAPKDGEKQGEEKPAEKPADGKPGEEKPPDEKPADGKPGDPEKKPEAPAKGPDVIKKSETPTQLVVVGNAVFISDAALSGGGDERTEITAALALNLVNWLTGSPDLIALRAKRYTNRALVDKSLQENVESWQKQYMAGEMDDDTFRDHLEQAREEQKTREKRSRWLNVILPIFAILFSGAVVWVVRAANRAGLPRIPPAVPPDSLAEGGTDS